MIYLNPRYEAICNPDNIDEDCDRIAHEVDVVGETIKEILKVGNVLAGVTMYYSCCSRCVIHHLSVSSFWE